MAKCNIWNIMIVYEYQGVLILFGIRRTIFIILLAALMSFVFISVCYANPAEPPSILIIVPDAPDDLDISIGSGGTHVKAKRRDKLIESYYISKNLFV